MVCYFFLFLFFFFVKNIPVVDLIDGQARVLRQLRLLLLGRIRIGQMRAHPGLEHGEWSLAEATHHMAVRGSSGGSCERQKMRNDILCKETNKQLMTTTTTTTTITINLTKHQSQLTISAVNIAAVGRLGA